jgi:hypothetical protein
MNRFFKEMYRTQSLDIDNVDVIRNVERGMNPFIIDALGSLDNLTSDREQQLSLCELGIGGGGAHAMLLQNFQDSHILGVELFSEDNFESYNHDESGKKFYVDRWNDFVKAQHESQYLLNKTWQQQQDEEIQPIQPNRKPSLLYGLDAYKKSTAEHLVKVNGAKLDYVNDDASPHLGALNGLMDAYKDSISDSGILISTGPFGNGTQESYSRWESGEYLKDLDTLAEQGFVVFDMTEYRQRCHINWSVTEYILSYLVMWAPDFNNYNDLLVKYEHNIIKGKENWKHD